MSAGPIHSITVAAETPTPVLQYRSKLFQGVDDLNAWLATLIDQQVVVSVGQWGILLIATYSEPYVAPPVTTTPPAPDQGLPVPEPGPGDPPPPSGPPTEYATIQWPVKVEDTDIALTAAPTTVAVGSLFGVDKEYMTVTDISNPDNPVVKRGTYGTTAAAHQAGNTVAIWGTKSGAPVAPDHTLPPPTSGGPGEAPPPTGLPTEYGVLHLPLNDSTDDIVALEDKATTAIVGSVLGMDKEYMTVTDATNLNNLKVKRATYGSTISSHQAGNTVSIWGTASGTHSAHAKKAEPRPETKAEERRREEAEEDKEGEVKGKAKPAPINKR
jgi:hypothetical protein